MQTLDIQQEVLNQLVREDLTFIHLCQTNKQLYKKCSSLEGWAHLYHKYNLPLPKINFTKPQQWISHFKNTYNLVAFTQNLMRYLQTDGKIRFVVTSQRVEIVPYSIFDIQGIDKAKVYSWLENFYYYRLVNFNQAKYTRLLTFSLEFIDEDQYQLHIKYYRLGSHNNIEDEDFYVLTTQSTEKFLYECLFHGLLPATEEDQDRNFDYFNYQPVI